MEAKLRGCGEQSRASGACPAQFTVVGCGGFPKWRGWFGFLSRTAAESATSNPTFVCGTAGIVTEKRVDFAQGFIRAPGNEFEFGGRWKGQGSLESEGPGVKIGIASPVFRVAEG